MKLSIKHPDVFNRLFNVNSEKENLKTAVENLKVIRESVKIEVKKLK